MSKTSMQGTQPRKLVKLMSKTSMQGTQPRKLVKLMSKTSMQGTQAHKHAKHVSMPSTWARHITDDLIFLDEIYEHMWMLDGELNNIESTMKHFLLDPLGFDRYFFFEMLFYFYILDPPLSFAIQLDLLPPWF